MNFSPLVIAVLGAVFVFEIVWLIKTYNSFQRLQQATYEARSNLLASLEKRYIAVSRVQQVVGMFNEYEQNLQTAIVRIREGKFSSTKELNETVRYVEGLAGLIVVKIEADPNLVSAELASSLMKTLVETEYSILGSRLLYNRATAQFLDMYRAFPHSFVAKAFGFVAPEFFAADLIHGTSSAPAVQFAETTSANTVELA